MEIYEKEKYPLVVDLDGTLLNTDMLHESAINAISHNPFILLTLPKLLLKGKAYLKHKIAACSDFDSATLPYNTDFLSFLKQEHVKGRQLVLCTASDRIIAEKIANYLNIFDEVYASDGEKNLSAKVKADFLVEKYGEKAFDYAGNSKDDCEVFKHARQIITVNPSFSCLKGIEELSLEVEQGFNDKKTHNLKFYMKTIRVHQWLKNILLFTPLFTAHLFSFQAFITSFIAFLSFSFCASSIYIVNDLVDIENDRHHPRKKNRMIASGSLSIVKAIYLVPCLLLLSLLMAALINSEFMIVMIIYLVLTTIYSFYLKSLLLIDCITLASLYTIRVLAGTLAIGVELSFWLLAFSIFIFFSLALNKRYSELKAKAEIDKSRIDEQLHGRAYILSDMNLLSQCGVASGYISVLIFALYLDDIKGEEIYENTTILWFIIPVLLYWISHIWMSTQRNKNSEDPILFAITDRPSIFCAFIIFIIFLLSLL